MAVAGFYSNDFGQQGGSDEQIAGVTQKYGVRHDQFVVAPVIGPAARPLFAWLLSHHNPGPKDGDMAPTWNFSKWLVSRKGEVVAAFDTRTYWGEDPAADRWKSSPLVLAIEAQLKAR